MRQRKLKVSLFPQNDDYVPSIRVAGKWLADEGFPYGTEVELSARDGIIIITRKEVGNVTSNTVSSPESNKNM